MSTPMDHIAYLSQEIGPRPAGTEEEQQAALYITERLQKDAHLSAQIEDFTCNSNALMTPIICYGVAIVAVLLGIILPVIAIPAGVLALAAAAVAISEALDHPLLSQVFTKGVSQNIVAKYEPTQSSDAAGSRRRKVIVVANYDSGKVRRETAGVFVRALRPLRYGALGGMVVAAVFMLLRGVVLSEGAASLVLAVLAGVCLIPSAALLVFALLEKFGPFTEAANDNASGVAVMLEVARRLGNGEVSTDAPIATGEDVSFVSEKREPSSISDNLVQLKDGPIVADTAQQRKETMAALTGAPEGPLAEVAAKAAELNEKHAQEEAAADARAAYEERVRARHEAEAAAAEAARIAEAQAASAAAAAAASRPASVPDWYKKATEKAREKMAESNEQAAADDTYRSRFADYPTGAAQATAAAEPATTQDEAAAPAVVVASEPAASAAPVARAAEPLAVSVADESKEIEAPKPSADMYAVKPAEPVAAEPAGEAADPAQELTRENQPAQTEIEAAPVSASEEPLPEVQQPAADKAPVSPAAATTRLPQMMYYQPPADRSAVQAERATTPRVIVEATAAEAVDIAVDEKVAVQQSGVAAYEAAIAGSAHVSEGAEADAAAQPAAKVISANIPVVDLPRIELPPMVAPEPKPISFDELRQRAPLASAAENRSTEAAKSLLSTSVPQIETPALGATVAMPSIPAAPAVGAGAYEVPSAEQRSNVSLTGSFSAISSIGAEPVGDELLEGVEPEDMYIDDADDSAFQSDFTETGAFAGPGYVEMPQSRVGKFFGKFRRKKKEEEESASEWLGVGDDFDAREVGKARGGWESFRDEDDDWNGGAFSNMRARVLGEANGAASADAAEQAPAPAPATPAVSQGASVSSDSFASAYEAALRHATSEGDKIETAEEIQQIYSFAAGDINTEVWFVALGSELANNGGIKAFLAEHAPEMRGAVIVNLEALGGGTLSYLEHEGDLSQAKCSPRMKRFIKKASQASGVQLASASIDWKESPASYAAKHRMQAMSLVGMDGYAPARYAQANDMMENIDSQSVDAAADFVVELLKNI
ncbi:M28 family peptidase [Slackia sp.]